MAYIDGNEIFFSSTVNIPNVGSDFSIIIYNSNGGTHPVKFATVDYSTCASENGIMAKISMVSGHGNGTAYNFLQDVIISVNYLGTVEANNFKYYGDDTTYEGSRQYGDIFWVVDTDNKTVDFYCLMGQYARVHMTPWKRLTWGDGGNITQHTNCTIYSSGEKVWAINSNLASPSTTKILKFTFEDGTTEEVEVYTK